MTYSRIKVISDAPPVVEIDSESACVYIRFKKGKVSKTISRETEGPVVSIDLDSKGDVLGIEFVGVQEFTIRALLKKLRSVDTSGVNLDSARYVRPGAGNLEPQAA